MSRFRVVEHVVPAAHILEYPRNGHELFDREPLRLAVKQYIPRDTPAGGVPDGAITLLGLHANGVPKELYEPLWDDVHAALAARGVRIRSIWTADIAFQGASFVLNEGKLGRDTSWHNHPRDLLNLVNLFRGEFQPPIFAIGHSMGGTIAAELALLHPALFAGVTLIEPIIFNDFTSEGPILAGMTSMRRDAWPSRKAAAAALSKSPMFAAFDPRVWELYVRHALRDLPTSTHKEYTERKPKPNASLAASGAAATSAAPVPLAPAAADGPPVTLTTPVMYETIGFARYKIPPAGPVSSETMAAWKPPREDYPDVTDLVAEQATYRSEINEVYNRLPELRPRVLYIGANTYASPPALRKSRLETTGAGFKGNGGHKMDPTNVVDLVVESGGHFVPLNEPASLAAVLAPWLAGEQARWVTKRAEQAERLAFDKAQGHEHRLTAHEIDWLKFQTTALKKQAAEKKARL